MILEKIISGGQTGADRSALETARQLGIPTGGTVPKGWKTESGSDYSLRSFGCTENDTASYVDRTYVNVHNSDATAWFGTTDSRGFKATIRCVNALRKPYIVNPDGLELLDFLRQHSVLVLNVAGNRASHNREVASQVSVVLTACVVAAKIGEVR